MPSGSGIRERRGRIAHELTSFVGRRLETAQVKSLLSTARLVTLTGVGGAGKTRLAVRVATELRRAFPDGAWQVDLAGVRDERLCAYAILETLALTTQGTDPPLRILENYLAERRLLLVLDNCEHLIDACAEVVGTLLRAAPDLRVLCTSRQPLGIVGEALYVVPPLGVPARDAPLARGDDSEHAALTLFVARAEAVSPGFVLTADNQAALVEICERLDGLPLAIELAAVQLRARSVAELRTALARRVQPLSARYASPAHHRGLRDSFDWSFELCSPAEQRLWPRLSVFAGSFDLDAVAGVCADEDLPAGEMLNLVAGLVDKSIMLREGVAGEVRYRLLETVREYGQHRLSDDELAALRRRHRDWYLDLAERFEAQWFGPDQPRWSARLRADEDNLRGALGWCLDTPGEAQAGLRLVGALQFYWIGCGRLTEGRYWLERMLPTDPAPTAARVVALSAYTMVLLTQNDVHASAASTEECLALARQLGDPYLIARATGDLGMHMNISWERRPEIRTRDYMARAQALYEDSLARHAGLERPDQAHVAQVRTSLAASLMFLGEPEQALRMCAECDAFCQAYGERYWRAFVLNVSAMVELVRQDPVRAAGHLRDALPLHLAVGDVAGLCQALELLTVTTAGNGDPARVARLTAVSQQIRDLGQAEWNYPEHRARVEEVIRAARGRLGEREYEAAYQQGWQMSLEEAVAYAVDPQAPVPTRGHAALSAPESRLTRRERQVAELVGQGMSNREIAGKLVISQRTAETHIENVLRKLGFTSRAQIAVWIAERARDETPVDGELS